MRDDIFKRVKEEKETRTVSFLSKQSILSSSICILQSYMLEAAEEEALPLLNCQFQEETEKENMTGEDANTNRIDARKAVGFMWKIHFSIGLMVLCFGIMCNGGGR